MIKYTDKQKLDAVKAYSKGSGGLIATAAAQGVNVASLRKWVAGYDFQGDTGRRLGSERRRRCWGRRR